MQEFLGYFEYTKLGKGSIQKLWLPTRLTSRYRRALKQALDGLVRKEYAAYEETPAELPGTTHLNLGPEHRIHLTPHHLVVKDNPLMVLKKGYETMDSDQLMSLGQRAYEPSGAIEKIICCEFKWCDQQPETTQSLVHRTISWLARPYHRPILQH
jgi:hypothetical protein